MAEKDSRNDFEPIALGGDTLGYSYAREFARVYGKTTRVLATDDVKYSSTSRFTDYEIIRDIDQPPVLMEWLRWHADEYTSRGVTPLILGGASDWHVRTLSKNKLELEEMGYAVPYIDFDLLDDITQKDRFYARCQRLGIPYPRTIVIPFGKDYSFPSDLIGNDATDSLLTLTEIPDIDYDAIQYPCVAKPSNSADWHYAEFPDKHKVFIVNDADELREIVVHVSDSSYHHALLVQEMLSRDDQSLRTITTFSNADGDVIVGICGNVLVQDRSATGIGNPLVIMGWERHDYLLECASRFVKDCGYEGYANFDVMLGHDGKPRFLEVNTRPGRNSFYVTLAGCPFVKPIVEEYVLHHDIRETLTDDERKASKRFLFSMVPRHVVATQVKGDDRRKALSFFSQDLWQNPLLNGDDDLKQRLWAHVNFEHMRTKFR